MSNENKMILTLDLDGTAIKSEIERRVRNEIVEDMKKQIKSSIYVERGSYDNRKPKPAPWVEQLVKDVLTEYKDDIVERAATQLAVSMTRSKSFRDKFENILVPEVVLRECMEGTNDQKSENA